VNLRGFALLTDENVDPGVVTFLRDSGFDVMDVKEAGLVGATDDVIAAAAIRERRVIVSHDSDFGGRMVAGEMVSRSGLAGLIFVRPGHIEPRFTIETLAILLKQELDLLEPFIVVAHRAQDAVRIRVRRL